MIPSALRVVTRDDLVLHDLQHGVACWRDFTALFGSYIEAISRRFNRERQGGEADRQDAEQETYLLLLDPDRPRYDPARAGAKTYVYCAVRSAFNVVFNRRRAHEMLEPGGGWPEAGPEDGLLVATSHCAHDESQFLEYLFRDLGEDDLDLFMAVANDRSIKDLSEDHGTSRPTMSRRVRRIRERLQTRARAALSA